MARPFPRLLRRAAACTLLILLATVSFLFSPAPQTEDEYCGTYLHLTSFAGFTANCDGFVYLEDARHPGHLLETCEVRQSRPLFILLGTLVGYPCTWLVQALTDKGVLPEQVVAHLPAKYQPLLGFYAGYVLLNYAVLLVSMLVFIQLYRRLTLGRGSGVVLASLLVFFASNQVTKAFFWTVHQQMFTFLVPLLCVALVLKPTRPVVSTLRRLVIWSLVAGLLVLVYGSFVLVLPCLLYAYWQQSRPQQARQLFTAGLVAGVLFIIPSVLWVGLLRLRGVPYYNHETQAYGQLVWLLNAVHMPHDGFVALLRRNASRFLSTLPALSLFGGVAFLLLAMQHYYRWPVRWQPIGAILGVLGVFTGFFAVLGYYRERLTFILVPLLLCLLVALLPPRLPRWAPGVAVGVALGWHLWQVVSYGPFS